MANWWTGRRGGRPRYGDREIRAQFGGIQSGQNNNLGLQSNFGSSMSAAGLGMPPGFEGGPFSEYPKNMPNYFFGAQAQNSEGMQTGRPIEERKHKSVKRTGAEVQSQIVISNNEEGTSATDSAHKNKRRTVGALQAMPPRNQ